MGQLGIPDEYECWIVDSLTQQALVQLAWSELQYERVISGVSTASVTVPPEKGGPESCATIGGLSAWQHMLVIERDGVRVWDGPVVGWSAGTSLTVNAIDRSAMLAKRIVAANVDAVGANVWTSVILSMLTSAGYFTTTLPLAPAMPYTTTASWANRVEGNAYTPGLVTGKWRVATLTSLADTFSNLATAFPLGWTQRTDELLFFERYRDARFNNDFERLGAIGTSTVDRTNGFPVLNDATIISPTGEPSVTVTADHLVTGVYKGTTGNGIAGFPNYAVGGAYTSYITSALYGVVADTQVGEIYALDWAGAPFNQNQFPNPYPKVTIEQIRLAPSFGNQTMRDGVIDLVPGAIWNIDFPDSCNLNIPVIEVDYLNSADGLTYDVYVEPRVLHSRLEELHVSASMTDSGLTEEVTASVSAFAWTKYYNIVP